MCAEWVLVTHYGVTSVQFERLRQAAEQCR
jgi:hypothetical protein